MTSLGNNPICYFAETNFRTERALFGLLLRDRLHHFYILGHTGTGKTTLLQTKIKQDLFQKRGVCLTDVHGDKFPASETFLTDSNGLGVFLGVSGADGGPVTMLPGDNHRAMASFTIGVSFNGDGHITGVMHNGKTYTVADWNKQFSNLNPQDGNVTTNFD